MKAVHDPIEILQKEIATWDAPYVELDCFGTDNAERIADTMDEFCRDRLGSTRARGQAFSKRARKSVFAHCVYCIAYGARCAHSLEPDKIEWEENTWPYLLKTEGEALLREAQP